MADAVDRILDQWRRERPDLDPAPMGIFGRLNRAQRIATQRLEGSFEERGLNREDFDVLATLRRAGQPFRLTPTDLYRSAMVSSGTMTGRLDRLERLLLVERLPHPTDRRGAMVCLTEAGRSLIDDLVGRLLKEEEEILVPISAAVREELAGALRELLMALEREPTSGQSLPSLDVEPS